MNVLPKTHELPNKSGAQPSAAVETKRVGPLCHNTLVRSGYAPVNGLEMYYEIHGTTPALPGRREQ
jgi:hypothetical protein